MNGYSAGRPTPGDEYQRQPQYSSPPAARRQPSYAANDTYASPKPTYVPSPIPTDILSRQASHMTYELNSQRNVIVEGNDRRNEVYGSNSQPASYIPPSALTSVPDLSSSLSSLGLANPHDSPTTPYVSTSHSRESSFEPLPLCVVHPDLATLEKMGNAARNAPDVVKIAWAKAVLKYVERHQSTIAGESSRIEDPLLVQFTHEALNFILDIASSPNPTPLSLYLRGDLAAAGSFPSYQPKNLRASFRDFEASANMGLARSFYRIGRAYEDYDDVRRAVSAFETGRQRNDVACTYRLAMASLSGQLGLPINERLAREELQRSANLADIDTPQPAFIWGTILAGEFQVGGVIRDLGVQVDIVEARRYIERAAYLDFGPAQLRMGTYYEFATLGCEYSPLLSVQYYALASQNGEAEADLALSKWYISGSDDFEKNENLAVTFAEKSARKGLPAGEFAMGYYRELGIGGVKDVDQAKRWYDSAARKGNTDAQIRLSALNQSTANALSRLDHQNHESNLVRMRTMAQSRSEGNHRISKGGPQTGSPSGVTDLRRKMTRRIVEQAAGKDDFVRSHSPPPVVMRPPRSSSFTSPSQLPSQVQRQNFIPRPASSSPAFPPSPPRQQQQQQTIYEQQPDYASMNARYQQHPSSAQRAPSPQNRSSSSAPVLLDSHLPIHRTSMPPQRIPSPLSSSQRNHNNNHSQNGITQLLRASEAQPPPAPTTSSQYSPLNESIQASSGPRQGGRNDLVIPAKKPSATYDSFSSMGVQTTTAKKQDECIIM